ncbi:MAG: hypothetical protein P1S60_11435 [Anaerolineae bacterium]|nr:hypothetical protein [Anaerolineae bacterium]
MLITQIAAIFMLLYAVGVGFLNRALHNHLPPLNLKYTARWLRPWLALFWMWGPTFWFVPGLVWFRILGIPQEVRFALIGLNFFLPLSIFVIFTSFLGLFPYRKDNPFDMLVTYFSVGVVVVLTAIFVVMLFVSPLLSLWQVLFYIAVVVLHPSVALLSLSMVAPKLIPSPSPNPLFRLRTGLTQITAYFTRFPKPVWMVDDGSLQTRVPGDPFYGSGDGWLLTEPENVAVLGDKAGLTRIEPPGIVLTRDSESPYRLVDLRNQTRSMNVVAVTRDGIEVNVPLSFSFRIQSGPRRPRLKHPWPIHRRDILQAVFAEVVDPAGKTPLDGHLTHPWEDLPLKLAVYKVKQAVAFYSLVQLYEAAAHPALQTVHIRASEALEVAVPNVTVYHLTRLMIGKMVQDSVQRMLRPHGFHIYAGGIVASIVPLSKELTRQRVEAWKTLWISKVMHWQAEKQTKTIGGYSESDDGAALDFIDTLINQSAQMTKIDDETSAKQALANHILANLKMLAQTPAVSPLLPDSVLHALTQLHNDPEELS